ncbi:hypothetical protein K493DRAFT_320773 [Basidiobolus meristosporus CBS 931.73]|uniref:G-protein coupled receptors family 2 profile 2 domain-containing protein n=1 Tax=Basidiobolus meristosporus CBS 931.73 TaxID=1314790 RepID=A0A1Y1X5U4_9FUNG|nr:hypothetical protein K493DRAFT_320773 [Basidiobolus meristosporus CBS 931.73]|eukprot:ORX81025.1 hypothetical protein K493DRAFT_320773 [Basidiobolus meristosporus CBS 931.73]
MMKFTIISMGLPAISMIPLLANLHDIEPLRAWCWIQPTAGDLRIGTFYGWLLLSCLIYIVLLAATLYQVSRLRRNPWEQQRSRKHPYERFLGRYVLYVVIFLLCWIPGVVNRIIQLKDPNYYNFILNAIQTFLSISESFWLSLVFGFTANLSEIYRRIWKSRDKTSQLPSQSSNSDVTKLEDVEVQGNGETYSANSHTLPSK